MMQSTKNISSINPPKHNGQSGRGKITVYYDPYQLGLKVKEKVCKKTVNGEIARKVYRYRVDKWYGGILTADVVGCNLRCRFCWAWKSSSFRSDIGFFQTSEKIADRLLRLSSKSGLIKARLSGGEPLLCPSHALRTAELVSKKGLLFIIETNGLVLDRGSLNFISNVLGKNKRIYMRVSLKGCSKKSFSIATGALPQYFEKQISFIENLVQSGLMPGENFWVAVMRGFCEPEELEELKEILSGIHKHILYTMEIEDIILYPHVRKLLEKYRLTPRWYIFP